MEKPVEDYADAIGRLLVRVYEIHERVLARGGGGLKDEIIRFCVEVAEESRRLAEGEPVEVKTISQIADWLKGLIEAPAAKEIDKRTYC
jgi:hypothetical protein